mgnify:CR=1 FL=1
MQENYERQVRAVGLEALLFGLPLGVVALPGYGPVTWGVPLRPGDHFPIRKECRWPRDVDHIEIEKEGFRLELEAD